MPTNAQTKSRPYEKKKTTTTTNLTKLSRIQVNKLSVAETNIAVNGRNFGN
jgi:hypothetical protein